MGQGGRIKLTNMTPFTIKKVNEHSYQMKAWTLPSQIKPGESTSKYVEFSEGIWETTSDDFGKTDYVLSGSNDGSGAEYRFQVKAKFRYINVDIKNMAARVFPALIPPQSSIIELGWKHDGEVFFAVLDKPSNGLSIKATPQPVRRHTTNEETSKIYETIVKEINNGDIDQSKVSNQTTQEVAAKLYPELSLMVPSSSNYLQSSVSNPQLSLSKGNNRAYWLRNWMWQYQQFLGDQKITSLILPGTHDSGTYAMVSVFAQPWTQCQNLDLNGQLESGARVLDIRTGIQGDEDDDNRFILVHDIWRTSVTMASALDQVINFCNENTAEVVILDYHRFVDLNGATELLYTELIKLIKTKLGDKLIPESDNDKTLNELIAGKGRVIVAWNRSSDKPSDFWSGVNQKWWNKPTKTELYDSMTSFYDGTMPAGMWSACAVLTADIPHIYPIQSLNPDLSLWFSPDGSWALKSNIVSCDFIETTQLAEALVQANMIKIIGN